MKKEQIMKIVEEAFNTNISTWASETVLGLESGIEGKENFFEEIEEKLSEQEKIHVCDFCSWEGTIEQMNRTSVRSYDKHSYTCPECGWVMINNSHYNLRKV